MCRPSYFDVTYTINPWMDPEKNKPNNAAAIKQWIDLHHLILRLGSYVEYVEPIPNLPDLCFTANAGLFHNNKVVLSRFKHAERQQEEKHFKKFFQDQGYDVFVPEVHFEGAGDAFVVKDTLFLGTGFRTNKRVAHDIMDFLGLRSLILCDLIDPYFYHLDTCFCPLDDDTILYHPGAFSPETLNSFSKIKLPTTDVPKNAPGFRFVPVDDQEAKRFACNAVAMRDGDSIHVILPSGCEAVESHLTTFYGFKTYSTPMDQFMKSGGACKCLTLLMSDHSN
jgi:N-dimethylarginine dimethylaminohydrolase